MIRVVAATEPPNFDARVRQPGLSAIAELVGEPPSIRRRGPRRAKVADTRQDIPPDKFPAFWTHAHQELLEAYQRICAYVSVYIEPVTGVATVDHMVPKSTRWAKVYEWTNYRLACSLMNARKGVAMEVLDPFEVENTWFRLELVAFQVLPGCDLAPPLTAEVEETIRRLDLNCGDCRRLRADYATAYWERQINLAYFRRRAPFLAMELVRQRRLNPGDVW